MRFGKTAEEAASAPSRSNGGGSGFIKRPKEGDNVLRILEEPDKWIYFWEHYNPTGFSFPCLEDDRENCPGCTSDNVKMKKASYKAAMNCFDGQYTNVWSFPNTAVIEKLKARYERIGTITDRDYLIRQVKKTNGVEYDVEGLEKEPLNIEEYREYFGDVGQLLQEAYEQSWGDGKMTTAAKSSESKNSRLASVKPDAQVNPDKDEKVVSESELRAMNIWDLVSLCQKEGYGDIPKNIDTVDEIVDWMLSK